MFQVLEQLIGNVHDRQDRQEGQLRLRESKSPEICEKSLADFIGKTDWAGGYFTTPAVWCERFCRTLPQLFRRQRVPGAGIGFAAQMA